VAARDLEHRADERRQIELVAAEAAWLGDPIEPGAAERLVQLRRIGAALLVCLLLLAQTPAKRSGAGDNFGRGDVRLGDWYLDDAAR
jgi:hypothetical protein